MIDSPGAEPVVLALWLAVNTLQVILSHQERKGRRKKAMKVTGVVAMGMTGSCYISINVSRKASELSMFEKQMTVVELFWKEGFGNYF